MATRRRQPQLQLSPAARKAAERKAINKASRKMARDIRKTGTLPAVPEQTAKSAKVGTVATQPAVPTLAQLKLNESALSRNRQQIWPWLITIALGSLGEGLYYAHRYFPRIPAATALVVTVVGALLMARIHIKAPKELRLWGDACVAAGGAFLWWITGRGLDWSVVLLGLLGTIVLGTVWWPRHRHPYPPAQPVQVEAPPVIIETVPVAWSRYVAHPKGALPGIPLADHKITKHTEQWTVALPREGTETVSTVQGKLDRLSHALNRPLEDLIWERHPHLQFAGVLQVVTNSPIKKPVFFDQPRMRGGAVLLGPYADAASEAVWRVYTENSMWGGFIVGCTGSGKSRVIEEIAVTLRAMRNTVIWFADGQNGASSPLLRKNADWFCRANDFDDMIDALEDIASYRQDKLNYHEDDPGFTPSIEFPGLLVIMDECHRLLDEPGREKRTGKIGTRTRAERINDLAAEIRKLGIGLLLSTQHTGLESFGGIDKLRSSIQARNTVVMRMTSRIAQGLIPNFDLDATKLPKMPGYAYTVGSEEEADGTRVRTAPFRSRWLMSAGELTKHPECPYPSIEQWFEQYPAIPLDEPSARAAGPVYNDRHAIAQRQREELRRRVEGGLVESRRPVVEPKTATQVMPGPDELFGDLEAQLDAIPEFQMAPAADAGPIMPSGLSGAQQKVWMAIAKNYTTPASIATFLKLSPTYVNAQLKALIDLDLIVHNGANGAAVRYELAERYGEDEEAPVQP